MTVITQCPRAILKTKKSTSKAPECYRLLFAFKHDIEYDYMNSEEKNVHLLRLLWQNPPSCIKSDDIKRIESKDSVISVSTKNKVYSFRSVLTRNFGYFTGSITLNFNISLITVKNKVVKVTTTSTSKAKEAIGKGMINIGNITNSNVNIAVGHDVDNPPPYSS